MTETDLFAAHIEHPASARWFSLASHCLEQGYTILAYTPEKFEAEHHVDGDLESAFLATLDADRGAQWTWWWHDEDPSDGGDGTELVEEGGLCEFPHEVLVHWQRAAFPH